MDQRTLTCFGHVLRHILDDRVLRQGGLEVHVGKHAHKDNRHIIVYEVAVPRHPKTEKISSTRILCDLLLAGVNALAREKLVARKLLCCGMFLVHGTAGLILGRWSKRERPMMVMHIDPFG